MRAVYDRKSNRNREVCENCYTEDQESKARSFGCGSFEVKGNKCEMPGCGAIDDLRPSSPLYRNHLFSLSEATSEIGSAVGAADTAIATSKLVGKTVANAGVIVGKIGWWALKNAPKIAAEQAAQFEKKQEKEIRQLESSGQNTEASELRGKLEDFKRQRAERAARSRTQD